MDSVNLKCSRDYREPDFLHRITLAGANMGNFKRAGVPYLLDLDRW